MKILLLCDRVPDGPADGLLLRVINLAQQLASRHVIDLACFDNGRGRRPLPGLFDQSAAVWQLSLINASLCTVLPVFVTMFAVRRIGAGLTAQAGMVGPVSTLFLGWWLLAEPITALQLAGTGLVLGGIFLLSARKV